MVGYCDTAAASKANKQTMLTNTDYLTLTDNLILTLAVMMPQFLDAILHS